MHLECLNNLGLEGPRIIWITNLQIGQLLFGFIHIKTLEWGCSKYNILFFLDLNLLLGNIIVDFGSYNQWVQKVMRAYLYFFDKTKMIPILWA